MAVLGKDKNYYIDSTILDVHVFSVCTVQLNQIGTGHG